MLYDIGQLVGSPIAGLAASRTRRPHLTNCLFILAAALPVGALYLLQMTGGPGGGQESSSRRGGVGTLLFLAGAFAAGPQNLLATAVPQEMGKGAALATVASVVDALGSLGAAVIQLLVGHLATCRSKGADGDSSTTPPSSCDLDSVFLLLVTGTVLASLLLVRLAVVEHRSKKV